MQLRPAGRKYANCLSQVCELLVASMRTAGRKYATGPIQGCDARWVFDQRFLKLRGLENCLTSLRILGGEAPIYTGFTLKNADYRKLIKKQIWP
jgi:hypothetical protein